ncbi:DNA primase [Virgibacillus salexigens]|uniref:DNA primase n=1 Tax=Virgibacillus massiliensis TaxID=1462526 RepID=A0A024QHA5_9BACI|nr:CHC2 zinc finger domain-containing protein [Virgibacillus massiliensis]CDQ41928.1 DNA primase [Virgibacillus massiliensis]
MKRHYPTEFLDQLQQQANLVEIISSYTQVEKMGKNYLAQCPFHDDHTPSLQINPETNTFYCHACAAGSKNHSEVKACNAIGFIQHIEKIPFPEAVEKLALIVGLSLPNLSPQQQAELERRSEWLELMSKVGETFHHNLKNNQNSLQYLGNRGITHLDIDIWKLGYCGDETHQNFANLRNRIVFPLFDYNGDIVSFTGRVPFSTILLKQLNEKAKEKNQKTQPKYKDTHGVNKGDHLFGMHIAKEYIRQSRIAIIVEGWTDVISLHRHGAKNAVSTMGVALTQNQINLLKRAGAKQVILMRDGDAAGILATERDHKLLLDHDIKCFIYPLENGMDPDNLCLSFGYYNENLLKQIYRFMQPIEQYKIAKIYKETQDDILYHYGIINQTQEDRLEKVLDVLITINDPVELDIYIRQLSNLLLISYDAIKDKIRYRREKESQQQAKSINPAFTPA